MIWIRRLGWATVALATLAAVVASQFLTFPEPQDTIVADRALFRSGDAPFREVALPPPISDRGIGTRSARANYVVYFSLAAISAQPLYLLVPATGQDFSLTLNDEPIFKSDVRAIWSDPMVRGTSLIRLPRIVLRAGRNELRFDFEPSRTIIPNYLSKIYIGSEERLAPNFRWRTFFEDQLKTMALAAQGLLGLGILIAFLYRPRDPLFSWLAALTLLTLIVSVGTFVDLDPDFRFIRPYVVALTPAAGLLLVGIGLTLAGKRPPLALGAAIVAIPVVLCLTLLSRALSNFAVASTSLSVMLIGYFVATGIVTWAAIAQRNAEARLMLVPFFFLSWFSARDAGIILGFSEGTILLAPYVRPLILAAVLVLLMRRLAKSLDRLDRANEELNLRLAEQEAELSVLHRQERLEAARMVREQERQRLTRDLHDGISGHLVSIIAMAERSERDVKPIEQAAREALDDLRLVIYSLDLGDRELPLALANFRERLVPRLRRIGVELEWSTAELPEIAGVTPGNALSILRILQEAITNAIKHGPARRIAIRGSVACDKAAITIENDGQNFIASNAGLGVENMQRRARQLGGELKIESQADGVKTTLLLPLALPDFEEGASIEPTSDQTISADPPG